MSYLRQAVQSVRVLVVGDVMLDRYWYGSTARISPEAPVPVVSVERVEERPGGAANVALNIAVLGGRITLIGVTGADPAADRLHALLGERGVDCDFTRVPGASTVTKLRVLSQHQQLIRLDFEDPAGPAPPALLDSFRSHLPDCSVVVLSDYAKGTLSDPQGLITAAREAGKAVIVDPKGTGFARYRGATVVTPNLKEFEAEAGGCRTADEIAEKAQAMCASLELDAVLVTRGEQGMTLARRSEAPLHLPAKARDVYDVTGAGDTVCAVLATALAAGHNLPAATAIANTAAGLVVAKVGAAAVTLDELDAALDGNPGEPSGIVDQAGLLAAVGAARRRGQRIVMTNGCFDLLHAGHVRYLAQARALGDKLVVAVNDDESVRRLKGPGRPLTRLANRMAVLDALATVDWVVPFSEDTPERLIGAVQPDVLVKGGDYRAEDVAGGAAVRARGGEVVILDYVDDCSTSAIIRAARQAAFRDEAEA